MGHYLQFVPSLSCTYALEQSSGQINNESNLCVFNKLGEIGLEEYAEQNIRRAVNAI